MKHVITIASLLLLSGCFAGAQDFEEPTPPGRWLTAYNNPTGQDVNPAALKNWWKGFNDNSLNTLIDLTLSDSPDRLIAQSRIEEARGLRRSTRSSLFPQIGATSSSGRADDGLNPSDNFYDAGFDASFEIDIFGKNRKALNAADAEIQALSAQYQDVTLTLIAETARSYVDFRAFQKQTAIAQKNLQIQEKTLELIRNQFEFGEAPQLDVERAENIVNTTKASIPEFRRLANNARLQLTVLTGKMPEALLPILKPQADIPSISAMPALASPADILTTRPDIQAASANLAANTALAESVTAELLPTFTLSGFFGIADDALVSSATIWDVAVGAAVSLIDFGRIEGRIDAARARESASYQAYRKTILEAVIEVETALSDVAQINRQRVSLKKAFENAEKAFQLSESLYREGEISFLDVLDAQRTVNEADSAVVTAEAAQAESIIRLYKSLGTY